MNDEFKALDKLDTVCDLLDELSVKYEIHRHDDGEFSYLADDEAAIKIPNPYADRAIFIDFQDEISMFFGEEWHEHYFLLNDHFDELLETLEGLLKNELCSAAVFIGTDKRWGGSRLSSKIEVFKMTAEEIFSEPCPLPGEAEELRKSWEKKGAEVHFLFWDTGYDKITTIEAEG